MPGTSTSRARTLPGRGTCWTGPAYPARLTVVPEVERELVQVRHAEPGARVVNGARAAGVEQVVIVRARRVQRRKRRPAMHGELVDLRVPEPGPVVQVRVDHRG